MSGISDRSPTLKRRGDGYEEKLVQPRRKVSATNVEVDRNSERSSNEDYRGCVYRASLFFLGRFTVYSGCGCGYFCFVSAEFRSEGRIRTPNLPMSFFSVFPSVCSILRSYMVLFSSSPLDSTSLVWIPLRERKFARPL